jgi:methylated-DNA-[protein]-cysteine S-methyltransferase
MSEYTFATIDSPLGRLEVVSNGEALIRLDIEGSPDAPHGHLQHNGRPGSPDKVIEQATRELNEYFAGQRTEFEVPIALVGTEFQQSIWLALLSVPFGETSTYGDLAARAGNPKAARAVGGAVGHNPVAIIVPCHRILAGNGKLTGYSNGNGVETKKQLLDLEGISYR